ncbi:MAG: hypothetical protein R3E39_10340 [Anaerolineae bacterium]
MGKLILRATAVSCGLWVLLIVLVLMMPHEDTQAQDFMSAVDNCGGRCIFNIQPGKTRVGEALSQLHNQPWVRDVVENATGNGYATISWGWNGTQPAGIDARRLGRITFFWEDENIIPMDEAIVETITIYTNVRHFSLQNWLGAGGGGSATFRPDGKLAYSVAYDMPGGTLNLYVEMACPLDLMNYWNAHTRMTLSIGHSPNSYVHPGELARMCRLSRS